MTERRAGKRDALSCSFNHYHYIEDPTVKNIIIAAAINLVSFSAFADGFKCTSDEGTLEAQVYNHRNPHVGTRTGAVMILSDSSLEYGSRTIARFEAPKSLTNHAAKYLAYVDQTVGSTNRAGEYIAGTRLGEVAKIVLDVDFSYTSPIADGDQVSALLSVFKHEGTLVEVGMTCTRYLVSGAK